MANESKFLFNFKELLSRQVSVSQSFTVLLLPSVATKILPCERNFSFLTGAVRPQRFVTRRWPATSQTLIVPLVSPANKKFPAVEIAIQQLLVPSSESLAVSRTESASQVPTVPPVFKATNDLRSGERLRPDKRAGRIIKVSSLRFGVALQ